MQPTTPEALLFLLAMVAFFAIPVICFKVDEWQERREQEARWKADANEKENH